MHSLACSVARAANARFSLITRLLRNQLHVVPAALFSSAFPQTLRTHTCGQLRSAHAERDVTLCGWVHSARVFGDNLIFLSLRDSSGLTQVVVQSSGPESAHLVTLAKALKQESVVRVHGSVRARPSDLINPSMLTGEVEVCAKQLEIISSPSRALPLLPSSGGPIPEDTRLQHRALDLRRDVMQRNLRLRSLITASVRQQLLGGAGDACSPFVEIETPTLFRSTPEGAREFLVPTRSRGKFYALVQSPQQYKQLLVMGGVERYFQLARCYRDESGRADRQPEFTQIDLEMGWVVDREEVMGVAERVFIGAVEAAGDAAAGGVGQGLPSYSFAHFKPPLVHWTAPPSPLPRLTYAHALSTYGSDKPDRRIGMPIGEVTGVIGKHGSSSTDGSAAPADLISLSAAELARLSAPPPVFHPPSDPSLRRLSPSSFSVRGLIAPSLSQHLSRKEGEALAAEIGKALGSAAGTPPPVSVIRVGEGGAWKGHPLAKSVPVEVQLEVTAALGGSVGDLLVLSWGVGPSTLDRMGAVRTCLAEVCRAKGVPLTPHGTTVPLLPGEPVPHSRLDPAHVATLFKTLPAAASSSGGSRESGAAAVAEKGKAKGKQEDASSSPRTPDAFWVVDFPLFSPPENPTLRPLDSTHHPFTAPVREQAPLLEDLLGKAAAGSPPSEWMDDALSIRGAHYDLVVNGWEVGGGSLRLHSAATQEGVFSHLLRLPKVQVDGFKHLLEALQSGAPPHGGIALGLDRLVALLAGPAAATSLRDVIAFPKSAVGNEPLTGAPSEALPGQLAEYHIAVGGAAASGEEKGVQVASGGSSS